MMKSFPGQSTYPDEEGPGSTLPKHISLLTIDHFLDNCVRGIQGPLYQKISHYNRSFNLDNFVSVVQGPLY